MACIARGRLSRLSLILTSHRWNYAVVSAMRRQAQTDQAVGVDEDGEPACVAHAVKTSEVNQPEKSKAMNDEAKLERPVRDTERLVARRLGRERNSARNASLGDVRKETKRREGGGEIPKEVAFQESREGFSSNVASISTDCDWRHSRRSCSANWKQSIQFWRCSTKQVSSISHGT